MNLISAITTVFGLSVGEEITRNSFELIQYQSVTDVQMDGQMDGYLC